MRIGFFVPTEMESRRLPGEDQHLCCAGYGSGIERKRFLLAWEKIRLRGCFFSNFGVFPLDLYTSLGYIYSILSI